MDRKEKRIITIREVKEELSSEEIKEKEHVAYPFIEGENIDLCPPNLDHIKLYAKWVNDSKARIYARNNRPHTVEDITKWFEPSERRGLSDYITFEIWHKRDKVPIGTCGFGRINWISRNANIFMSIGLPQYWNKNLGTEASRLLINYGFKELNFHKIYAGIFEPNIGSWSVAEKDGFILEGIQKKTIFINGQYIDARKYRMLKKDWLKINI
jgi:RimJ/RimL family protein N-acetyltransferase